MTKRFTLGPNPRQLMLEAAQAVTDKADRVVETEDKEPWSEKAFRVASKVLKDFRKRAIWTFTTESIVHAAHDERLGNLELPHDPRAWGTVILRLKRAGMIEHHGFESSLNPQAHQRPVRVWQHSEYL